MGSQALGSPAEAAATPNDSAPAATRPGRGRPQPRPRVIAGLFAGAWALPVLTHFTRTDILLVPLIVFGTGGLVRVGSTVVDRLMATLALLVGLVITFGLLFSVWPWGLQPIAIGGLSLTLLVGAYLWLGAAAPWRCWPRRLLGSDLVLLAGFVAAAAIAYGPSWGVSIGSRAAWAGNTGDRLRHFNLFDTIHRVGGYTFLNQNASKSAIDPGMLSLYPPGQHFVYALADIFLRSNVNPGNEVSELNRYNVWISLGFGFFVLTVTWAARWVAGPSLRGWRRVFLMTAVGGFLATGAFTCAVWSSWDPQVLGMAELALLAAFSFRPPAGARTHIVLTASLCVAIFLTYELFAPYAAILVAVSAVTYRKRLIPHWKLILAAGVIAIPAALSEYIAALGAGLNASSTVATLGFTIPFSTLSLVLLAAANVLGFAVSRARRRPSARAALATVALTGLALAALLYHQEDTIHTTSYYFQKLVEGWAVIMLVGAGTVGHLLRRPALPSRGPVGVAVGTVVFVAAIFFSNSFWWGQAQLDRQNVPSGATNAGAYWSIGDNDTWASVWLSNWFTPEYVPAVQNLLAWHMLGDGVPTLAILYPSAGDNVNLSLMLSVLNRDAGVVTSQVNAGLANSGGLVNVGGGAPFGTDWTPALRQQLNALESDPVSGIAASPVPLRVIVATPSLYDELKSWSDAHPGKISSLLYLPRILIGHP